MENALTPFTPPLVPATIVRLVDGTTGIIESCTIDEASVVYPERSIGRGPWLFARHEVSPLDDSGVPGYLESIGGGLANNLPDGTFTLHAWTVDRLAAAHSPLDPASAREQALAARMAYEDAVDSDGTSAAAWQRISDDMHATADLRELSGSLRGFVQCHRDRAVDAGHRAQYARRMLDVARRAARVIDMDSLTSRSAS